ncbi:MAG: hypothetical protein VB108_11195 [Anaerolineaceae bacterium]|nr:hypothetical protein [Anaerolineaceae bacterium]
MNRSFRERVKSRVNDPWSGTLLAVILLILVTISLVTVTTALPEHVTVSAPQQTATALVTIQPEKTPVDIDEEEFVPPVVNTDAMVIFGGLILVTVLFATLREVNGFRKEDKC